MPNEWAGTVADMQRKAKLMASANREIMTAFQGMRTSNHKDQALDAKTRELMAIAVAVALHCKGCIAAHVSYAKKLGATAQEISAAVAVAMSISAGSAYVYGLDAMDAFEDL